MTRLIDTGLIAAMIAVPILAFCGLIALVEKFDSWREGR